MPPKKKQKRMPVATDRQTRSRSQDSENGCVVETHEATGGEANMEATGVSLLWRLHRRLL